MMNKAIKMDTGRRRSEQPFCPPRSLLTRGESETHSGSPVCAPAFRSFLDGLAELIADAILSDEGRDAEQIEPSPVFQRRGE
jgi:hypothetical protein